MARKAAGDNLAEYRRKRDFRKTAEPAGRIARGKGFSFVVQKHDATRLHYDFRLELDGTLKSWAVTRGPSLNPSEKRLAVHVEDHPLDYGGFEGTIPKGEYGGGTVMLWDRGTWEPINDPHDGLKRGMLHFNLHGARLKGGWALVRMPPRGREKRENWLLIKERDEAADEADPLLDENTTSVKSGRSMEEIAKGHSAVWHSNRAGRGSPEANARARRAKARDLALPKFRPPQLATLVDDAPDGDDWLHELKYDGYRTLIAANGTDVRCYTRTGQDWTPKFQPIAQAFQAMDLAGTLIDGEIVSFNSAGRTDFSTLQKTLKEGGKLDYFAFDLLVDGGEDIGRKPLVERKERLRELLADLPRNSIVHYSDHILGKGAQMLRQVCNAGQEGIISKRANAAYRGERGKTWLKVKCKRGQEFVIGGWTPSDKRRGFRSILVGVRDGDQLIYKGRVGTGFNDRSLMDLGLRFDKLSRKTSPFKEVPRELRRSRWVEPKLVAEIAFGEFTSDGILRHPSFQGLREDKAAREVTLERPKPVEKAMTENGKDATRAGVRITSPEKVFYPKEGITKADLLDYYEAVADLMLPHLGNRPLSLVRCPQGYGHHCFFQKHDTGGFPEELKHVMIPEADGEEEQYFYLDDLKGIVAGVQMNVFEFHIWGSRVDQLEKPDRIVFDLDPDVGLGFEDVRRGAFDLRDRLAELGLKTFPMLSGGKGFHLVAPLTRRADWKEVKAFCHGFAVKVGGDSPDRYVANMSKAKRKGRIFVDYLRNERGSTAIAPYSTRTRDNAPVAAPITWKEAEKVSAANVFTVASMPERAKRIGDPWKGYFEVKQSITRAMMKKVGAE